LPGPATSWHVHDYEYSPAAAFRAPVTGTALFTSEPPLREYLPLLRPGDTVPIRTGMSNCTIMSETIYLIELSFGYTY
jgi:hypothetical protein